MRMLAGAACVVLALGLGACGSDDEAGEPAGGQSGASSGPVGTVGVNATLTGPLALYGQEYKNGAEMAQAKLKEEGIEIELDVRDNKLDLQDTVRLTREMMREDDAVIVGTIGTQFLAAIPVASKPLVSSAISTSTITGEGVSDWVVNTFPEAPLVGSGTAEFITQELKATKVASIYEQSDFGKDAHGGAKAALKARGVDLVVEESVQPEDTDFSAQIARIKAADVEALYVWTLTDTATRIIRQARQNGYEGAIMGGTTMYYKDGFEKPLGKFAEGVYFSTNFLATTPEAEQFVTDYAAKYGSEPNVTSPSTYDAVMYIGRALKEVGKDPKKLVEYMRGNSLEGVTGGEMSFDETGAVVPSRIFVAQWKGGEPTEAATYNATEILK
jgi:branched-chain amino acid transport system substrate-binding protein